MSHRKGRKMTAHKSRKAHKSHRKSRNSRRSQSKSKNHQGGFRFF
uniref:Uncharacterized protein n=1 Tax=viral metagenome TaxID=1070528 RepID=A0A6C0E5L3_9ZZZZ